MLNYSYRNLGNEMIIVDISFEVDILIMISTLYKYFTKLIEAIFLKFSNLSDRAKRSKMREFSDILSNHFFNINVRITQIMVFCK